MSIAQTALADSTHPHDALFEKNFSEVEHAAPQFRAVLPPELVALTNFSTLALCPGSYVDEERIDAATPGDVDRWLERVLTAATVDAVLVA